MGRNLVKHNIILKEKIEKLTKNLEFSISDIESRQKAVVNNTTTWLSRNGFKAFCEVSMF